MRARSMPLMGSLRRRLTVGLRRKLTQLRGPLCRCLLMVKMTGRSSSTSTSKCAKTCSLLLVLFNYNHPTLPLRLLQVSLTSIELSDFRLFYLGYNVEPLKFSLSTFQVLVKVNSSKSGVKLSFQKCKKKRGMAWGSVRQLVLAYQI